jgi:hypothetical protein
LIQFFPWFYGKYVNLAGDAEFFVLLLQALIAFRALAGVLVLRDDSSEWTILTRFNLMIES